MVYRLGHLLFSCYFKLVYRWQIFGLENIPASGPFIICSNHISWFDPPLIGCSIPPKLMVYFMAKQELFKNFIFGAILKKIGAFPIDRNKVDYAAIRTSFQLLAEGKVICLFPEGTRSKSGRLQPAHPGAAMIAARSKAPVLPVAITGPYRPGRPLLVNFGPVFYLPNLERGNRKDNLKAHSKIIMSRIGELLIPDQERELQRGKMEAWNSRE
ncbi:MAG: 1-acyl-sn-glycerol-3-phosphate acyltransferase [Firmicutes bacterium]|mgnify:CR=1 FL=1|nr:1-acyl-sn-glycerol-3-phosphate acyltransferase [Bacillota bacterium]